MFARSPSIVADSTISLPIGVTQGLPLFVVPFDVHHEGILYSDLEELSADAFYELMRTSPFIPTTSAPNPAAFLKVFETAAQQSDEIICLTLSRELSAANNSAHVAKEEARRSIPWVTVTIVDSRTAGPAEGLIALEAARMAMQGSSVSAILAAVTSATQHVYLMAYLETLEYVSRSGRVPRIGKWLGQLLDFKPIFELAQGHISLRERPRKRSRAMERIVTLMQQRIGEQSCRVVIMHASAPMEAAILAAKIAQTIEPVELITAEFTPVIGAHTGPGLVGCAFHVL